MDMVEPATFSTLSKEMISAIRNLARYMSQMLSIHHENFQNLVQAHEAGMGEGASEKVDRIPAKPPSNAQGDPNNGDIKFDKLIYMI